MAGKLHQFTKVHYYCIPLVALVVWWGMLTAMFAAWGIQGRPVYSFMNKYQNPAYISDVGATNLNPLFISCTGFQMIFFIGTLVMELVLRKKQKLQPYVSTKQPTFAIISIVLAIIGELGILMVSIFKVDKFHTVHVSMVVIFIAFIFLSCVFNFSNTFIFGNFPQRLHPNHERVFFGKHRWSNLYMLTFFIKVIWLMAASAFALCFLAFMKVGNASLSAVFEWLISYWYGLLLVMWSMDLIPSAVKHYRIHHPAEFSRKFVDNHKRESTSSDSSESI